MFRCFTYRCNGGVFCRHLWDEDLESWDMIEKIDDNTDVFFYTTKSMILQPKRRHVVLRWTDHFNCAMIVTVLPLDKEAERWIYLVSLKKQFTYITLFDFVRSWTDLDRGVCALVSTSINHPRAPPSNGVPAIVLASRYLVEPLENGKSRLTHISRVDQRWGLSTMQ